MVVWQELLCVCVCACVCCCCCCCSCLPAQPAQAPLDCLLCTLPSFPISKSTLPAFILLGLTHPQETISILARTSSLAPEKISTPAQRRPLAESSNPSSKTNEPPASEGLKWIYVWPTPLSTRADPNSQPHHYPRALNPHYQPHLWVCGGIVWDPHLWQHGLIVRVGRGWFRTKVGRRPVACHGHEGRKS